MRREELVKTVVLQITDKRSGRDEETGSTVKSLFVVLSLVLTACAAESTVTTIDQAKTTLAPALSTTTSPSTTTTLISTTSTTVDGDGYDWSQVTFEDLVDWIPGGLSNLPEAASESLRSCEGFYLGVSAMTQALMVGADGMFQIGSAAVDGEASVSDASIAFSQWSDAALMVAVTNKDIFETGPGPEAEQYLRDLSDLFSDAVASASLIGLFGFDVEEDNIDQGTLDVWLPSLVESALGLQPESFIFPESVEGRCS